MLVLMKMALAPQHTLIVIMSSGLRLVTFWLGLISWDWKWKERERGRNP